MSFDMVDTLTRFNYFGPSIMIWFEHTLYFIVKVLQQKDWKITDGSLKKEIMDWKKIILHHNVLIN